MSVYTGKFDLTPFAKNENMFVVFMNDWTERSRVLVFSTFTKDAGGIEKRPFDLTTAYVLQAQDFNSKNFTIRDLDKKAFYWFECVRNDESSITLKLADPNSFNLSTIQLTKLHWTWR